MFTYLCSKRRWTLYRRVLALHCSDMSITHLAYMKRSCVSEAGRWDYDGQVDTQSHDAILSNGEDCNQLDRISGRLSVAAQDPEQGLHTWPIRDPVQLVPILAIAKGCIILLCAQLPDVPPSLSH